MDARKKSAENMEIIYFAENELFNKYTLWCMFFKHFCLLFIHITPFYELLFVVFSRFLICSRSSSNKKCAKLPVLMALSGGLGILFCGSGK